MIRRSLVFAVMVFTSFLAGCSSNKSLLQSCADIAGKTPAIIAVPVLLTACIGAGVADEAVATGKLIGGGAVGTATQLMAKANSGKSPGSLEIYGNWCGPGNPKPGETPEPIDELDLACKHHDKCYERFGYYTCRCDVVSSGRIGRSTRSWPCHGTVCTRSAG